MIWWLKCLLTLAFVVTSSSIAVAAPAGTATGVDPEAQVSPAGETRKLVVGADIFIGDVVQTSSGGRVEIEFSDSTRLIVGPGSSLVIEDYLLRSDGSAGNFVVGALAGTYRFMSGTAASERYSIRTPSGTIGIRGTAFDLVVDPQTDSRVLMYSGATELCPLIGACTVISSTCELGEMAADAASSLGNTDEFTSADRRTLRSRFVFGAIQQQLGGDFRLRQAARCLLSPLPFSPAFFRSLGQQRMASETGTVGPGATAPTQGVSPVTAAPSPPPPPAEDGGCAGHSSKNPGNSQNCSK